jgi:hypothetical protein
MSSFGGGAGARRRQGGRWCSPALVFLMVVAVLVGVTVVGRERRADAAVASQQVAVPSYIPPNGDPGAWNRLIGSDSNKVGIVVANVANGPDFETKPMWTDVMSRAHGSGKRVLGYVDTGYMGLTGQTTRLGSSRSADWIVQIEQDINRWYQLYPGLVDGIFFDQGHNSCGDGGSIPALYRFINEFQKRSHINSMTVLNPGAMVPQCYEDTADVLLTYESSYAGYMQRADQPGDLNYHSPDWTPRDPRKFWHIIYGVSPDHVGEVIATSRDRNAGYVFVTDDVMVNPYDTLPQGGYWTDEQNSVGGGFTGVAGAAGGPATGAPGAPGGLRVESADFTSARLAWDGVGGAAAYVVNVDGHHIVTVPGDTTTVTVGSLAPGGHGYGFTVQALDPAGNASAPSNTAGATTTAMPDNQTVAHARASDDGTTVTFSADFLAPYSFHRVFIGSSTPNLNCWQTPLVGRCAVWVIEGNRLFRYTGDSSGTQWSWQVVRDHVDPEINGYTYTWRVPFSDMPDGTRDITVSGDGYGPLTYVNTNIPDWLEPAVKLAAVALAVVVVTTTIVVVTIATGGLDVVAAPEVVAGGVAAVGGVAAAVETPAGQAAVDEAGEAIPAAGELLEGVVGDLGGAGEGPAADAGGLAEAGSGTAEEAADAAGSLCGANSFAADTPVLLADGTLKAIGRIRKGDRVLATDPTTGRTGAQGVTATMVNDDDDLVDLAVNTPRGPRALHTTAHHRIWSETRHGWTRADDLRPGEQLRTSTRQTVTVAGLAKVPGHKPMLDLTVEHTHTFYVAAGPTTVLVHNCGALRIIGDGFSDSERRVAQLLADQGKDVLLREATGPDRMSDLVVNGVDYDVYSPTTGNVDRIVSAVASKGSQVRGGGVVIDLSGSPLEASDLDGILARVQGVTDQITDIVVVK